MDWEEYEYVESRDLKNQKNVKRNPRKALKTKILRSLYRVDPYNCLDPKGIAAKNVAYLLDINIVVVKQELSHLVDEGFLRKIILPKFDENNEPCKYYIGFTGYPTPTEWDGHKWVRSATTYYLELVPRKRNGAYWTNPPKRIVRQLEKKALKLREPTGFDGVIYEILKDNIPYIKYGGDNDLFSAKSLPTTEVSPELCKRCGGEVQYKIKQGKRKVDHKLRDCNLILVEKMMND